MEIPWNETKREICSSRQIIRVYTIMLVTPAISISILLSIMSSAARATPTTSAFAFSAARETASHRAASAGRRGLNEKRFASDALWPRLAPLAVASCEPDENGAPTQECHWSDLFRVRMVHLDIHLAFLKSNNIHMRVAVFDIQFCAARDLWLAALDGEGRGTLALLDPRSGSGSGSGDGTDAGAKRACAVDYLRQHTGAVNNTCVAPNGCHVFTGSDDVRCPTVALYSRVCFTITFIPYLLISS